MFQFWTGGRTKQTIWRTPLVPFPIFTLDLSITLWLYHLLAALLYTVIIYLLVVKTIKYQKPQLRLFHTVQKEKTISEKWQLEKIKQINNEQNSNKEHSKTDNINILTNDQAGKCKRDQPTHWFLPAVIVIKWQTCNQKMQLVSETMLGWLMLSWSFEWTS